MNYQDIYNFIFKLFYLLREKRNDHYFQRYLKIVSLYKERNAPKQSFKTHSHHIFPKSFGGGDEKANLVNVTYREHFILHHILYKAFPQSSMVTAFEFMCSNKSKKYVKFKVNSKIFDTLMQAFSKRQSENRKGKYKGKDNPFFGKTHSDAQKEKWSKNRKGAPGHHLNLGKKRSQEDRQKCSDRTTGKDNPMFGKTHSEESKEKMSEKKQGYVPWNVGKVMVRCSCIRCGKEISQMNLTKHWNACKERYHKIN